MKQDNQIVIINGKKAKMLFNKSHADDFTIDKANIQTVELIDALLMGADSSLKYSEGITTMRTLTTLDGFMMRLTRISNHIGIIRFYLPTNSVFTFKIVGEPLPRYGVAKSKENINALQDLRENILKKLGKQHKKVYERIEVEFSKTYEDNRAD